MCSQKNAPHILIDGYIANMFTPARAQDYFGCLLKDPRGLRLVNHKFGAFLIPVSPMLQQAHHVPLDCVTNFRRGTVVPQRLWCPKTTTDLRQYVVDAPLQMPIFFVNQDGSVGLSVNDAIEGNSLNSVWANIPANLGGKASTHIRIAWPGYKDWKRQFQTKDETSNRKPITQGKLVKHVGRSVDVFLKLQNVTPEPIPLFDHDSLVWRVGESGITHDDIIIVGIVHVSSGSWQPILQLNRHICLSMCGV